MAGGILRQGVFQMSPYQPHLTEDPQTWVGQHFLSVQQLTPAGLEMFLECARNMKKLVEAKGGDRRLENRVMGSIFFEPSTRTSCSFQAAFQRLGGSVIHVNESTSSAKKGESLADTICCMACYCDAVVLRHPVKGSAAEAAAASKKPVINAGDGTGEHPTQSLLDVFTIFSELGGVAGKTVTMVGDLKHGRTVHSLAKVLGVFKDVTIIYVSPASLAIPEEIKTAVGACGVAQVESTVLTDDILARTDVLYVTRVQKERFERPEDYDAVKDAFIITKDTLSKARSDMVVMHPLPRVNEISTDVDSDPRAAYFRQMENGMYARMALLALLLGKV